MEAQGWSRRAVLSGMVAGATASLPVHSGEAAEATTSEKRARRRVVRLAHLTDIHVQPEREAAAGMAACLQHVHGLADRPDLILNGGDMVMDTLGTDWARAKQQWDLWDRVLREDCKLRIVHCLGNHDVWGWDRKKSGTTGNEPLFGKRAAMERLGLQERFYSLDLQGWRLFVLDSTHAVEGGVYTARLDEAQFDWFAAELRRIPATTPVLVLSHIPILCGCAFLDGENEKSGNWVVPGAWMHTDARRIKDLFVRHPNVRLCLSGHIHLRDRLDYNGVTYLCNGAVSGGWWKGPYQETQAGYAVVDLFDDGTFEHQYLQYRE